MHNVGYFVLNLGEDQQWRYLYSSVQCWVTTICAAFEMRGEADPVAYLSRARGTFCRFFIIISPKTCHKYDKLYIVGIGGTVSRYLQRLKKVLTGEKQYPT